MKARFLIPLFLFMAVAVFLGIGLKLDPRDVPSPLVGKAAPHFDLPSLHDPDKRVTPGDFKGQVWLLNVWATWCASCRQEHATLVEFSRFSDVPIVGLDWKDEDQAAKEWLETLGDPYSVVAVDSTGRTAIDWGVYGAPETYLIDQQGIIQLKHTGPVNRQIMKDKIIPKIEKLQETS